MDELKVFFLVMIGIGIVINIIGWTDYYRNRSQKKGLLPRWNKNLL